MTILNMRTMPHACMWNFRPTFDTDVECVKATALMVLAGTDPWTILVTWLNGGCFVTCKANSLVFNNDTCHYIMIHVSLSNTNENSL